MRVGRDLNVFEKKALKFRAYPQVITCGPQVQVTLVYVMFNTSVFFSFVTVLQRALFS